MQEESKTAKNMKISIQQELDSPAKRKNKSRGWSFRSLFLCCDPQNFNNDRDDKHKLSNSITTGHYSAGDPSSFVQNTRQKDHIERIRFTNQANSWARNNLFLLGRGSKRIICKMTKTELNAKPTKTNQKTNDSRSNKVDFDFYDSFSPKRSISDLASLNIGNTETRMFTRQEIFSLYSQGIRVEKSDWNEVTPECIAQHIANRMSGKFVIDALSGYGGNAIQVTFALELSCS